MLFALLLVVALWRVESDLRRDTAPVAAQLVTGMILGAPYHCRTVGLPIALVAIAVLAWRRKPVFWTLAGLRPDGGAVDRVDGICHRPVADRSDHRLLHRLRSAAGRRSARRGSASHRNQLPPGLSRFRRTGALRSRCCAGHRRHPHRSMAMSSRGVRALPHRARAAWRARLLPCCLLAYVAMICLWPWPPWRFFVPVLPFMVAYVADAFGEIARRFLRNGRHRYLMASAAAVVLALNLAFDVTTGRVEPSGRLSVPLCTRRDRPIDAARLVGRVRRHVSLGAIARGPE